MAEGRAARGVHHVEDGERVGSETVDWALVGEAEEACGGAHDEVRTCERSSRRELRWRRSRRRAATWKRQRREVAWYLL